MPVFVQNFFCTSDISVSDATTRPKHGAIVVQKSWDNGRLFDFWQAVLNHYGTYGAAQ